MNEYIYSTEKVHYSGIIPICADRPTSSLSWQMSRCQIGARPSVTTMTRQNDRHLADDIFTFVFFNEKCISVQISLRCLPKGLIVSIGSYNGLAPSRWQAIIRTNDGYITDAYMRDSSSVFINMHIALLPLTPRGWVTHKCISHLSHN